MLIAVIIIAVCALYLYAIAPNTGRQEQMTPFMETYIAHRGLFDNGNGECGDECSGITSEHEGVPTNQKDISEGAGGQSDIAGIPRERMKNMPVKQNVIAPENSMPAFKRAVAAGFGIELDVQTTADGRLVVFHDETLIRMCGIDRRLYECTYEELQRYSLAKTDEKIPLFKDVLDMINGRVPLIVEVKSEGNWRRTTRMTAEHLDSYIGTYCMESFHPLVVKWFRDNRPDVLRGQLSTDFFRSKVNRKWYEKLLLTNLMLNFLSRPDFVAYNYRYSKQPSFWLCRHLFSVVSAAWTVKSEKVLMKVKKVFNVIIFDSFVPKVRDETR